MVDPFNVPHERVYRALAAVGIEPSRALVLGREEIARATKTTDEKTVSAIIDQWKQAGVLAPAGSKRWKLGESFLAYVEQRVRDE